MDTERLEISTHDEALQPKISQLKQHQRQKKKLSFLDKLSDNSKNDSQKATKEFP